MGGKKKFGYNDYTSSYQNVKLPDKIECGRCLKYKGQNNFSQKQLTDARERYKSRPNLPITANCRQCTGTQPVELECYMCHKTKGLDDFAKAQRTNPDHARCMQCMEKHLELEPVDTEKYDDTVRKLETEKDEEVYIDYYGPTAATASSISHTDDDDEESGGVALGMDNLSVNDSISSSVLSSNGLIDTGRLSQSITDSHTSSKVAALGGKGWVLRGEGSWQTQSTRSASMAPSTGGLTILGSPSNTFNPDNYSRSAGIGSGIPSGSFPSVASNVTEPSESFQDKGGWAKMKAYKPPPKVVDESSEDEWESDEEATSLTSPSSTGSPFVFFVVPVSHFAKMSGRRGGNRIRGPHSALTDFLAANNISAQEIRDSYRQRVEQAVQQTGEEEEGEGEGSGNQAQADEDEEDAVQAESAAQAAARSRKRKRNQDEAIAKIKKGKEAKKQAAKKQKKKKHHDSDGDYDSDDVLNDMYKKAKPLPGQLENCEVCGKRFTVTPYSKAGPEGGLLCTPCGKEMAKDAKAADKAKKPTVRKARRKIESNRLDGITTHGAKSLQQLCIEKLAHHHLDIEEFGELPDSLLNRLSEIFSKKRVMNPRTMQLFLRPDLDTVAIHEAAYLETEDYNQIFAVVPKVEKLVLRNCCQLKDSNIDYMAEKAKKLKWIELYGGNLVGNDKWIDLFINRGKDLEALKLEWLDAAFDDQAVEALVEFCPNVSRLKLKRCRKLGVDAIEALARFQNLRHLSLQLNKDIAGEPLANLVSSVGAGLRTLSLEGFVDADDKLLAAVHDNCRDLVKFRFSENDFCTDAGYVALFENWENPPLRHINVNSARDLDNTNPEGPEEPNGLASEGFKALMAHSGSKVERLDISSCRHISYGTLTEVFDGRSQYPELKEINLSFCTRVDTVVVAGIFRSCPALKKLVAFGCFQIEDVVVPKGIVLIGVPRAHEALEQFGDSLLNVDQALGAMVEAAA